MDTPPLDNGLAIKCGKLCTDKRRKTRLLMRVRHATIVTCPTLRGRLLTNPTEQFDQLD
jgi:hypothetical protein